MGVVTHMPTDPLEVVSLSGMCIPAILLEHLKPARLSKHSVLEKDHDVMIM